MQNAELNENGNGQGSPFEEITAGPLTRDQVLILSSTTIRQLHKRVNVARFKEQRSDGARLSHVRALIAVLQVYSALLRDDDLETLKRRVEGLERLSVETKS